jgi:phosphatidylglycerol:prolipoprotein diacylglycerol transferase
MQQVLFHIPLFKDWFPPDGIPIHGFGAMLFITFVAIVAFFGWRSERTGTNMPRDRIQDLVIMMFVGGLMGARVTYMIQYNVPLTIGNFIRIWEGGIVLYGGVIAGVLIFIALYYGWLKRFGVNFWKLTDAAAPAVALGIALGRLGCFLNGCCYGHIAPEDCPSIGFPTLTAPAKDILIDKQQLQTVTGFLVTQKSDDIRSVVTKIEPGSKALAAGLQAGDRIVAFDGQTNGWVITVVGSDEVLDAVTKIAEEAGARVADTKRDKDRRLKIVADDPAKFREARKQIAEAIKGSGRVFETDTLSDLLGNWPRGQQSLELVVERNGERVELPSFTPRTIGLHPTQLYETISMLLLVGFLLAYYPFRHHDGQIFTLFIACYAVHRFMNEILRNDTPVEGFKMTLSQNISVVMLTGALILELILRVRANRQKVVA